MKMKRNTLREEIVAERYFSGIYFRDFAPKLGKPIPRNEQFSGCSENTIRKMNHLIVNRENKLHEIKKTECILPIQLIPAFTHSNLHNNF